MGRRGPRVLELEHGAVRRRGERADGRVGEEEGGEVQEGFRRRVSKEEVVHGAGDLVGMEGEMDVCGRGWRLVVTGSAR